MTQELFEKNVMQMLLRGEGTPYKSLFDQYQHSCFKSRNFTGRGFILEFFVPDEFIIKGMNGVIMDVFGKFVSTGTQCHFILHVKNGKLDYLEGVTLFGDWEDDYNEIQLFYDDIKRKHEIKIIND